MKPHLTEKSYLLATAAKPAFTFLVSVKDNTAYITKQIKQLYGKDVVEVRFVSNAAKKVTKKGVRGTVARRRKALVILKANQTIAAFDIPTNEKESPKKNKE